MIFDLRRMPILVLNLEEDTERRRFMESQLAKFELQPVIVPGVRCDPPVVGCALSHLRALKLPGLKPPFLILEDDCELFEDCFRTLFDVPRDTDALYLGHSGFGLGEARPLHGLRWGEGGKVEYRKPPLGQLGYLRFLNVLSRHAILYITPRFQRAAIRANQRALYGHDFPVPGDVEYATIQPDFQVFATEDPLCCQSKSHAGKFGATRRSVLDCAPALS